MSFSSLVWIIIIINTILDGTIIFIHNRVWIVREFTFCANRTRSNILRWIFTIVSSAYTMIHLSLKRKLEEVRKVAINTHKTNQLTICNVSSAQNIRTFALIDVNYKIKYLNFCNTYVNVSTTCDNFVSSSKNRFYLSYKLLWITRKFQDITYHYINHWIWSVDFLTHC